MAELTPTEVDREAPLASGLLGGFRSESGRDEWRADPDRANLRWRRDEMFCRARGIGSRDADPARPIRSPEAAE